MSRVHAHVVLLRCLARRLRLCARRPLLGSCCSGCSGLVSKLDISDTPLCSCHALRPVGFGPTCRSPLRGAQAESPMRTSDPGVSGCLGGTANHPPFKSRQSPLPGRAGLAVGHLTPLRPLPLRFTCSVQWQCRNLFVFDIRPGEILLFVYVCLLVVVKVLLYDVHVCVCPTDPDVNCPPGALHPPSSTRPCLQSGTVVVFF